jgi:hypothetical protein
VWDRGKGWEVPTGGPAKSKISREALSGTSQTDGVREPTGLEALAGRAAPWEKEKGRDPECRMLPQPHWLKGEP